MVVIDGRMWARETLNLRLALVPPRVKNILIAVNVYTEGKTFGDVGGGSPSSASPLLRMTAEDANTGTSLVVGLCGGRGQLLM